MVSWVSFLLSAKKSPFALPISHEVFFLQEEFACQIMSQDSFVTFELYYFPIHFHPSLFADLHLPSDMTSSRTKRLVVATRIHLGNASTPPATDKLKIIIDSLSLLGKSLNATQTIIAADAAPILDGYDLIDVLRSMAVSTDITIVPVTPWNKFVPALNAILSEASGSDYCLMMSVETHVTSANVEILLQHMDEMTLVAGAVLPGHDFYPQSIQPLNGRTTPWNTLAIWNLAKLSLTGFVLVADGVHLGKDGSPGVSGIEEVSTIAVLQRILGADHAKVKLVPLSDNVKWETNFEDEERRAWHEHKMNSKLERATRHLELLSLKGTVLHLG